MSALSFQALASLVDSAPDTITNDELIDRAWNGVVVSSETVTQRIRLLRQALDDDAGQPRYIATVRNEGYRLVSPPVAEQAHQRKRPWAKSIAFIAVAIPIGVAMLQMSEVRAPSKKPGARFEVPSAAVTARELVSKAGEMIAHRDPQGLAHAIDLYEQALALDPDSAAIKADLSLALSRSVAWYGGRMEVASRAERLARESLEQEMTFAAEFSLAFSLDAQGWIETAQVAYERAVALEPGHYGARASLAYLQQERGRLVEALSNNVIAVQGATPGTLDVQIASCLRLLGFHDVASRWFERADSLDPDSAHAAVMYALDLMARGRFVKAGEVISRAEARGVEQVEFYEYGAIIALQRGDYEAAMAAVDGAPDSISHRGPIDLWRTIIQAMATGKSVKAISAAESIRSHKKDGNSWPGDFLYLAMLEAISGRRGPAIGALRDLFDAGYRDYLWIRVLPPLKSLHDDPAYSEILAAMKADADRQRQMVLGASWLPDGLLEVSDATH